MSKRLFGKAFFSLFFLGIAGCLVWYSVCTNRIFVKDLDFIRRHPSAGLFSEVWLMRGNLAYYVDLDSAAATEHFRKAIARQPLLIDAWLALAKAGTVRGYEDEENKVLTVLAPSISHVSTWKWQELLLAYDERDEKYFAACFNFILSRLPHRIQDASYLALDLWDDWAGVLPHITQESRPAFLKELMKAKQVDVALLLWKTMEESSNPPDKEHTLRFCQFLLGSDMVVPAKEIWRKWKDDQGPGVHDGGFELKPLNSAFGWRVGRHPEVSVDRTLEAPYAGNYSLQLHFRGIKNVAFSHVSQIVPVQPGHTYRLKFAQKSRNLTTDSGVFLALSGYKCKGLSVQSEPVTGTTPWALEELQFSAPATCEAVSIQVRRKESLKFDSKISGDYWLDALELKPADE